MTVGALNLNLQRRVPRQQLYGCVSWFYVSQFFFTLDLYIVLIIRYILVLFCQLWNQTFAFPLFVIWRRVFYYIELQLTPGILTFLISLDLMSILS